MPKVEKLNWEPPVRFRCDVSQNVSLPLEKYLNTNFEFCSPLVRLSTARKIVSGYKSDYLINQLTKAVYSQDRYKPANALYLLILISDYVGYREAKDSKKPYVPLNKRSSYIHAFLEKVNKADAGCGLAPTSNPSIRVMEDLAQAQIYK